MTSFEEKLLTEQIRLRTSVETHEKRSTTLEGAVATMTNNQKWIGIVTGVGLTLGISVIGWLLWLNTSVLSSVLNN